MDYDILLTKLNIVTLREHQSSFIDLLKENKDLFVILPTGYGKSIGHQVAPYLNNEQYEYQTVAIIVMPLTRLMKEQSEKLIKCGCNAVHFTGQNPSEILKQSDLSHIFISPEDLVNVLKLALVQLTHAAKKRFSYIFIDESHCVVKWGQGSKKSRAFRSHFADIGSLRAVLPDAALIALTATATTSLMTETTKSLGLINPTVIRQSPERNNIRYSVVRVTTTDIDVGFQWLSDHIREKSHNSERIMIFCRMLKHIGLIYEFLCYHHGSEIVQMYHSKVPEDIQNSIFQEFKNPTSKLKIVICSSSFSMGIDIPELYNVVHYGMPTDIDQYMQEAGRIGRDGKQSHACVIYHPSTLTGKLVTAEVKAYIKTNLCRRKELLKYFGVSEQSAMEFPHQCCDNCSRTCLCGEPHTLSLTEKWFQVFSQSTSDNSSDNVSDVLTSDIGSDFSVADSSQEVE